MKKINICVQCGSYTLQKNHCDHSSRSAHPPPYNPNDRYGEYRRKIRGV